MQYPQDFSKEAIARVEAEKILATQDLQEQIEAAPYPGNVKELAKAAILQIIAAFAKEACELGFQGKWAVDYVETAVLEALRVTTLDMEYRYSGRVTSLASNGYIRTEIMQEFHQSKEWKQYQKNRLAVARAQAQGKVMSNDDGKPIRKPALPQQTKASLKASRRIIWEGYHASLPEKVYIADVCWAAKQRRREWTRWRSGELKDGSKADKAFRAVLASGQRPEEYRPEPRPKTWK